MPEIKNEFTSGKMNKDLDERLVRKGEYRHAMNIQVSTSEHSDVGTIQNILGNEQGCVNGLISPFARTVGSVSNEKDDSLYWFVSGLNLSDYDTPGSGDILQAINEQQNILQILQDFSDGNQDIISLKDMIVRKKTDQACEPVFVDAFAFLLANNDEVYLSSHATWNHTWMVGVAKEITDICEPGWKVRAIDHNGNGLSSRTITTVKDVTAIQFEAEFTYAQSSASTDIEYRFAVEDTGNGNWSIITDKILIKPVIGDASYNIPNDANLLPFHPNGMWQDVNGDSLQISSSTVETIQWTTFTGNFPNVQINTLTEDWRVVNLNEDMDLSNMFNDYNIMPNNLDPTMYRGLDNGYSNVGNIPMGIGLPQVMYGEQYGNSNWVYTDPDGQTLADIVISVNFNDISIGDKVSSYGNINYNHTLDLEVGNKYVRDNGDGTFSNMINIVESGTNNIQVPFMHWGPTGTLVFKDLDYKTLVINPKPANWVEDNIAAYLFYGQEKRVLKFNRNRLITGVNIIDDMLFWTDNFSEPKKINISDSIEGTDQSGTIHTRVVNKKVSPPLGLQSADPSNIEIPAKEQHITVIKQSPKAKLVLDPETSRNIDKTYSGIVKIANFDYASESSFIGSSAIKGRYDFTNLEPVGAYEDTDADTTFSIEIESDLNGGENFTLSDWKEGAVVVLKEFDEDDDPPSIPITDYRIKGVITEWDSNRFTSTAQDKARVKIEVTSIKGNPPPTDYDSITKQYVIDLFDQNPKTLFQYKFPRFSYRYRYRDGEYSTFAPFSDVAFIPGSFDYHVKKGYNLGMTNRLKILRLRNFITSDMPEDVVAIDLLYKDDASTNIYVVDTISPTDQASDGGIYNDWVKNRYKLTSDTIRAILPSNQLLRSWDNVPKKALAQDIVGNRIVYANYTQGYDLIAGGKEYSPVFKHYLSSGDDSGIANKRSIKSLRDYQIGVVFTDMHGRETPVLTNNSGAFKIDKLESINKNQLNIKLKNENFPNDITYFKFFIKETSGEYFNLPMDRWYDADDGNIWLSFQSSDRNKIDLDTYIVLKKGEDSGNLVEESARYKVLAIEDQAPEHIKKEINNIGQILQGVEDDDGDDLDDRLFVSDSDWPLIGGRTFVCSKNRLGKGNSLYGITDIQDTIYVEFRQGTKISEKYKISMVSRDRIASDSGDIDGNFGFTTEKPFEDDIGFIFEGTPTSPQSIFADVRVVFYREKIINSPKFDGKFFVKIYSDEVFYENIGNIYDIQDEEYNILSSNKLYLLPGDLKQKHSRNDYKAFGDDDWFRELAFRGNVDWDYDSGHSDKNIDGYTGQGYFLSSEWDLAYSGVGRIENVGRDYRRNHWQSGMVYWPSDYQYWRAYFKHDISSIWVRYGGIGTEYCTVEKAMNEINLPYDPHNYVSDAGRELEQLSYGVDDDFFRKRMPTTWHPSFGEATSTKNKNFTSDLFECMMMDQQLRNDKENGFEDVYFIDAGEYKGAHSSGWKRWGHSIYGTSGHSKSGRKTSTGIKNVSGSNEGRIELGVGPYGHDGKGGTGPYDDKWYDKGGHYENEDIWNLDNGYWGKAQAFFKRFTPGARFRWKEDPTGTIYTVYGSTIRANRQRFVSYAKHDSDVSGVLADDSINSHRRNHPFTYLSENHTKGFKTYFKPRMDWNPHDSEGVINGSRRISKQFDPSDGSTVNLTSDSTFGPNWLRIKKDKFQFTYDVQHNERAPIEVGMMLYRAGSTGINNWTDSSGKLDYPLIIKDIRDPEETDSDYYYIYFNGYKTASLPGPLNETTGNNGPGFNGSSVALDFRQPTMNGLSENSRRNINHYSNETLGQFNPLTSDGTEEHIGIAAIGYTLEFVTPIEREKPLPTNPSVWETEPKEGTDLDIYYEITENNPVYLTQETAKTAFPIGSEIYINDGGHWDPVRTVEVVGINEEEFDIIRLNLPVCGGGNDCVDKNGKTLISLYPGSYIKVKRPSGIIFTARIKDVGSNVGHDDAPSDVAGSFVNELKIEHDLYKGNHRLTWHNCFSFGNGVESNRIGDTFNMPFISNGVKASTTLEDRYEEETRKSGLIYSGIYNSTSGVNNLNQFIQAEKITKDINPIYGSIQKLHMRDSNLVTLCEDKVLKILAHKDALFNADGNQQLTATDKVLGQATPFVGEYGISKNPESFASESYRAYFTDKVRGSVLRLSMDGLTPISEAGMKDYFKDNLKLNDNLVGSYDDKKQEYNITLPTTEKDGPLTVTFREDVGGWVSFKSFVPESGVSCANEYYTFKDGMLWKHHVEMFDNSGVEFNRNVFYNVPSYSSFNAILNDDPGVVKTFNTLNYEGSQANIQQLLTYNTFVPGTDVVTGTYSDNQYYNLEDKTGWYVEHIKTDLEQGTINEFIKKEGKYFNYIRGKVGSITGTTSYGQVTDGFDNADNSFQGLGRVTSIQLTSPLGCTDDSTFVHTDGNTYNSVINYNENATIDDGSCIDTIIGCIDTNADAGYNISNNTDSDPTSCIYYGCTDATAINYNASANTDDGSCIPTVMGCTDNSTFSAATCSGLQSIYTYINYDPLANVDDGSCDLTVVGCTNPLAYNYNSSANYNDCSCVVVVNGCDDPNACNYDNTGSQEGFVYAYNASALCNYCGDTFADNYDGNGSCYTYCQYCNLAEHTTGSFPFTQTSTAPFLDQNSTITTNSITFKYPLLDPAGTLQGDPFSAPINEVIFQYFETNNPSVVTTLPGFSPSSGAGIYDYMLTGLQPDTSYTIQFKVVCNTTESVLSESLEVTTNILAVNGCTDSTACNYDANANTDDGSCDFATCAGCTDDSYLEYCGNCWDAVNGVVVADGSGTAWQIDDGSCSTLIVNGCTDPTAFNYDISANVDDGSCVPVIVGCMDDTLGVNSIIAATNYDQNANTPGDCLYETIGTTGQWILDANTNAEFVVTVGNIPVGSSIEIPAGTMVGQNNMSIGLGNNIYGTYFTQTPQAVLGTNTYSLGTVPASEIISNALAGSIYLHHQGFGIFYQGQPLDLTNVHFPGDTELITVGCTDATACNYDSLVIVDDGSCVFGAGCSDSSALNYDDTVICPDNNDCVYCQTDPGITTASLSYETATIPGGAINYGAVTWDDFNNTNTNGTFQLQTGGGTPANLYRLEYRFKTPGQNWSTWAMPSYMTNNSCNLNVIQVGANYAFTFGGVASGADVFGFGNNNDGRFNAGTKWRFRIRNLCTDCSFGPSGINTWSPVFTLSQDIISTI